MTVTRAREIIRDTSNFKYINTYKIVRRFDDFEVRMYSEKTGLFIDVYDREDIGGFTGAQLSSIHHVTSCNTYFKK